MPPSKRLQQPTRAEKRRQQKAERQGNLANAARDATPDNGLSQIDVIGGGDFSQGTLEQHAALLGNSRISSPMYAERRAQIVNDLQRTYGNSYVQRVVEHIKSQRARSEIQRAGIENKTFWYTQEPTMFEWRGPYNFEQIKNFVEAERIPSYYIVATTDGPDQQPAATTKYPAAGMIPELRSAFTGEAEFEDAEQPSSADVAMSWWYTQDPAIAKWSGPLTVHELRQHVEDERVPPHYFVSSTEGPSVEPTVLTALPAPNVPILKPIFRAQGVASPSLGKGTQALQGVKSGQSGGGALLGAARVGTETAQLGGATGMLTAGAGIATGGTGLEAIEGVVDVVGGVGELVEGGQSGANKALSTGKALSGGGRIAKGVSGAAYAGTKASQLASGASMEQAANVANASVAAQVFAPAAIAQGSVDVVRGGYGAYKANQRMNQLANIKEGTQSRDVSQAADVASQSQGEKRREGLITAAKGAVTVAGGAVLLAAGLSNPVGWYLLAAAGLIAGGAFIHKRWSQRQEGKKLSEQKVAEYRTQLDAWNADTRDVKDKGPEPELDPRYDPKRITSLSWRTYGDVYREELESQRKEVAMKLYEKAVLADEGEFPEMEQIVTTMGLKIDKENRKPTVNTLYKEFKKVS